MSTDFVKTNSSFLNSPAWERVNRLEGLSVKRLNEEIFIEHSFRFGTYWQGSRLQLKTAEELGELTSACFARLEPLNSEAEATLRTFAGTHGYSLEATYAVQPRQTIWLDLSLSEDKWRQQLKSKHRYNLGLAQKQNLECDVYDSPETCENAFARFWQLHADTAARQGFRTHQPSHYQQIITNLAPEQMLQLLFVREGGKDLATAMVVHYEGVATYLHGGSVANPGPLRAPYLLHWKAMQEAKRAGCYSYDLWGTDAVWDETKTEWVAKEKSASAGTTRFKLGFGGQVISYPGCFDLIFQPFCYSVYKAARQIRGSKRSFR